MLVGQWKGHHMHPSSAGVSLDLPPSPPAQTPVPQRNCREEKKPKKDSNVRPHLQDINPSTQHIVLNTCEC